MWKSVVVCCILHYYYYHWELGKSFELLYLVEIPTRVFKMEKGLLFYQIHDTTILTFKPTKTSENQIQNLDVRNLKALLFSNKLFFFCVQSKYE